MNLEQIIKSNLSNQTGLKRALGIEEAKNIISEIEKGETNVRK